MLTVFHTVQHKKDPDYICTTHRRRNTIRSQSELKVSVTPEVAPHFPGSPPPRKGQLYSDTTDIKINVYVSF